MKIVTIFVLALIFSACNKNDAVKVEKQATAKVPVATNAVKLEDSRLDQVLEAQADDTKARYVYRHPKATLQFFGIKPGMTVAEVLPGGGWYSQILVPYLGSEGKLIGLDYSKDLWSHFDWANEAFLTGRQDWATKWESDAKTWANGDGATAVAYSMATAPEELNGSVDAVLFIRALHNMARFEDQGQFLSKGVQRSFELLKPGGLVGVVQHQAAEDKPAAFADGSHGYLKKSFVKETFEKAGFVFVAESPINENPKDQPSDDDIVWRLPPSFNTSKDNEELRRKYTDIGESNRMTLLFKKPE